jgi:hypothetical protein
MSGIGWCLRGGNYPYSQSSLLHPSPCRNKPVFSGSVNQRRPKHH